MSKPSYAPVFEFEPEALRCPFEHFDEQRAKRLRSPGTRTETSGS